MSFEVGSTVYRYSFDSDVYYFAGGERQVLRFMVVGLF